MKINEKEVKIIKEYENFILVEFPAGYRECINKFDIIKHRNEKKKREPRLTGKF